jgi:hypothetical protein
MQKMSIDSIECWFKDFTVENESKNTVNITTTEIFDNFKIWLTINNNKYECNKQSFGIRLQRLNISVISKALESGFKDLTLAVSLRANIPTKEMKKYSTSNSTYIQINRRNLNYPAIYHHKCSSSHQLSCADACFDLYFSLQYVPTLHWRLVKVIAGRFLHSVSSCDLDLIYR